MKLIGFMITNYFGVPYEQFRAKLISIFGLFEIILKSGNLADDFRKTLEKDYKKLEFIRNNTHKDIMVSWYKLCRFYNRNVSYETVRKVRFTRTDSKERARLHKTGVISLNEDEVAEYLSKSIEVAHILLVKNLSYYNEDMAIPLFEDEKEDINVEELN